jgi:hypothetical protein
LKRSSVIVLVAAIIMSEALVFMIVSQPTRAITPWWDTSWQYRRHITIGSRPENYQIQVVIPDNIPKSDYPSIRFLWQVGQENYLLPYWIEHNENQYNTSGKDIAWVRVLDNSNDSYSSYLGGNTIYMYYHNLSAVSAENGDNVFLEFTDFGGGANTDIWGVVIPAGGSVTWLDGSVKTTSTVNGNKTRLEWGEGQGVPVSEENVNRIIEVRMRAEVPQRGGLVLSGTGWGDVEEACIFDNHRFWFDGLWSQTEQDNKWYIARADLYGANGDNTFTIFYYGADNAVYRTQAVTLGPKTKDWSSTLGGGDHVDKYNLISWDASTTSYFDWFFVRKWAATEPSVNVGNQETVPTAGASISLVPGWNLVCFTAVGATDTPSNLFAPLEYFTDFIIYSWTAPGGPYNVQGGDTVLLDNIAYWVFMTTSKTVNTTGFKPDSRTIFTVPGWNMVGFPVVNSGTTPTNKFAPEEYFTDFIIYWWTAPGGPYNVQGGDTAFLENTGYWVYNTITKSVTVP